MILSQTMKRYLPAYLFSIIVLCAPPCHSSDLAPFRTYNQNPVTLIFGLPAAGSAKILGTGQGEMALVFDIASSYATGTSRNEALVLDSETYLINLTGRLGVGERLEIGFEVPYIFHSGGFLDGFIEDYHSTFGFPQGGRDTAPNGRLLLSYQRNASSVFLVDRRSSGIGDIRLNGGYQLYDDRTGSRKIALRASLKLPTGESDQLRGSGGADLAVWLTGSQGFETGAGIWEIFGAGGILTMAQGDLMPEQQRNAVFFGSLGAGWKPLSWLALKVQVDGQTAFYKDSSLDELSSNSAQLIMGGSFFLSRETSLEIAVSEDLVIKTAPDVVFHLAVLHKF